jgi:hypothetical protein
MATKNERNQKDKGVSPVESPILFMDKFVSADTDQSPQDPPGSGTNRNRILPFP